MPESAGGRNPTAASRRLGLPPAGAVEEEHGGELGGSGTEPLRGAPSGFFIFAFSFASKLRPRRRAEAQTLPPPLNIRVAIHPGCSWIFRLNPWSALYALNQWNPWNALNPWNPLNPLRPWNPPGSQPSPTPSQGRGNTRCFPKLRGERPIQAPRERGDAHDTSASRPTWPEPT